jgi:putative transport protein
VLLINLVPRVLRQDLGAAAEEELDPGGRETSPQLLRAFKVCHETVVGRTLGDLDLRRVTGCAVTRLLRGATIRVPDAGTILEADDHVMARGTVDALHRFEKWVGPEIYDAEIRRRMPAARAITVQSPKVAGKTLAELDLIRRFHCLITRVFRGDVELEPEADLRLARDDIIHVAGARADVRHLAEAVGRFERSSQETDIAVYAGGIVLGVLLGSVDFQAAGFHWTLGFPGGLLVAGLLLGRFRRIGRLSAHVPAAARQLVRDLGVLLFVTETGLVAGASTNVGMGTPLFAVLLTGALATAIPVLAALLFAQAFLRMRPVDAWGSICGGMTSTAALVALRRAADSNAPAISYAAAFAVASVLLTVAGPVVVFLCG